MRIIKLFLFLFYATVIQSQDIERVDAVIQLYPRNFERVEDLSVMISRDFSTDQDKVRAIFGWIIHNVSYDPEEYKKFNYSFKNYRERNSKEEKTREQIIQRTISQGVAVCEGYAMLFEKLCTEQGISNYLVRGDIKSNFNDIGRPFRKMHMWNVAYIDGKPFLFDPTWGAGKYNGRFIKEPKWDYFKADPGFFIKTHFPDVNEDMLLERPVSREEYQYWPLIIQKRLTVKDLGNRQSGVIDGMTTSSPISFELSVPQESRISFSFGKDIRSVETVFNDGKLRFEIPFELGDENLLIYFDDKPALAYKIK